MKEEPQILANGMLCLSCYMACVVWNLKPRFLVITSLISYELHCGFKYPTRSIPQLFRASPTFEACLCWVLFIDASENREPRVWFFWPCTPYTPNHVGKTILSLFWELILVQLPIAKWYMLVHMIVNGGIWRGLGALLNASHTCLIWSKHACTIYEPPSCLS